MWEAVRLELGRLEWDAAPPLTQDLLSEWTQTVANLVAIRRLLGPVSVQDPVAMLATAATGAARTPGAESIVSPSLQGVSDAITGVAQLMKVASGDVRHSQVATLNHVAYELAHWVRVRATDDRVTAWLLAGETALDSAIHAPAGRSTDGYRPYLLAGRAGGCAARPGCPDRAAKRGARTLGDPAKRPCPCLGGGAIGGSSQAVQRSPSWVTFISLHGPTRPLYARSTAGDSARLGRTKP